MFKKILRKIYDRAFYIFSTVDMIKVGNKNYWYVPANTINSISYVVSGGVGNDISFETMLSENDSVKRICLFDPSETGINHISKISLNHKIEFTPAGLSGETGVVVASPPVIEGEGSFRLGVSGHEGNVEFSVLDIKTVLERSKLPRVDLLKIDIEGFEYDFIENMISSNIFPMVILVEYHHFYENITFYNTFKSIFLLHRNGYRIVKKINNDFVFYRYS